MLWDKEIFKPCNGETPKCVLSSLIYLAAYERFAYLLVSVILHVRKTEPKYLCRDWYSSGLLFTSLAASPFCRRKCGHRSIEEAVMCFTRSSALQNRGPRTWGVFSAADLRCMVGCSRRVLACTSCTNIHLYFVEDVGFSQSKVVPFCQEAFISLSPVFHGKCLMHCQRSDVASFPSCWHNPPQEELGSIYWESRWRNLLHSEIKFYLPFGTRY